MRDDESLRQLNSVKVTLLGRILPGVSIFLNAVDEGEPLK